MSAQTLGLRQKVPRMLDAALPLRHAATACAGASPFARVEVHKVADAILPAWRELERLAPSSAYQTQSFALAWLETIGKARGVKPLFIMAHDAEGRVAALLCFGLEQRGAVRIAIFLGGRESNLNLGLFRDPHAFGRADVEALLRAATRMLGSDAPDVFVLANQPASWAGARNPLALLPHQASPSYAYTTTLPPDAEQYFAAKQSKERRKKLRKKEARLTEMGALTHVTNHDAETTHEILAAFFAQKAARCATQAIDAGFDDAAVHAFFERVSVPANGVAALECHALALDKRILAVFAGMAHHGHFNGMVISFDEDPEIAKSSPGEILLTKVIAEQCRKGLSGFDLGIGEASYKATYCETPIALVDVVFPLTLKGMLYAAVASLRLTLKRAIKQRPEIFVALKKMRRLILSTPKA
jgi:CelD/BcsL family acetyltransferase involved in cellulose biosynthesis